MTARNFSTDNTANPNGCRQWKSRARQLNTSQNPNAVLLTTGLWDLIDARIPSGGDTWKSWGDPAYEAFALEQLQSVTDAFAAGGALVIWLTTPDINQTDLSVVGPTIPNSDEYVYSGRDNYRVKRLNDIIRQVVDSRPATARLIDFNQWMSKHYADTNLRPDGMHFDPDSSGYVGTEFLGPRIHDLLTARDSAG